MNLSEYVGIFIFFAMMLGVSALLILVSHRFAITVKSDTYDWSRPYECGMPNEGFKLDRYPIHYYLVGILFVIFDVETIFLVPWAVTAQEFREIGATAYWLGIMAPFFIVLVIGYMYDLRSGIFDWGHEGPPPPKELRQ
ncbi:NADH-quinone oxidoreductase subunit A [bacterium]|nr:NADH-quinone oxidoreductase subunit A [bacterium]